MAAKRVTDHAVIEKLARAGILMFLARESGQSALKLLAGFLACLGIGFLLLAGYWHLGPEITPEISAIIIGSISLGLAIIIGITMTIKGMIRRAKMAKIRSEVERSLRDFVCTLDGELSDPVRENPKTAAMVALLAGYLVGNRLQ